MSAQLRLALLRLLGRRGGSLARSSATGKLSVHTGSLAVQHHSLYSTFVG